MFFFLLCGAEVSRGGSILCLFLADLGYWKVMVYVPVVWPSCLVVLSFCFLFGFIADFRMAHQRCEKLASFSVCAVKQWDSQLLTGVSGI